MIIYAFPLVLLESPEDVQSSHRHPSTLAGMVCGEIPPGGHLCGIRHENSRQNQSIVYGRNDSYVGAPPAVHWECELDALRFGNVWIHNCFGVEFSSNKIGSEHKTPVFRSISFISILPQPKQNPRIYHSHLSYFAVQTNVAYLCS